MEQAFGIGRSTAGEEVNVNPSSARARMELRNWSPSSLGDGDPARPEYKGVQTADLARYNREMDVFQRDIPPGQGFGMLPPERRDRRSEEAGLTFGANPQETNYSDAMPGDVAMQMAQARVAATEPPRAPATAPAAAPAGAAGASQLPQLTGSHRVGEYRPAFPADAATTATPAPAAASAVAPAATAPTAKKRLFTLDPNRVYHYEKELLPMARAIAESGTAEDRADLRAALEQSNGYGIHASSLGGLVRGNKNVAAAEHIEKTMKSSGSMLDDLRAIDLENKIARDPLERRKLEAEGDVKEAQAKIQGERAVLASEYALADLDKKLTANEINHSEAKVRLDKLISEINTNLQKAGFDAAKTDEIMALLGPRISELRSRTSLQNQKATSEVSVREKNFASAVRDRAEASLRDAKQWSLTHKVLGGDGAAGAARGQVNDDLKRYKDQVAQQYKLQAEAAAAAEQKKVSGGLSEDMHWKKQADFLAKAGVLDARQKALFESTAARRDQMRNDFKNKYGIDPEEVKDQETYQKLFSSAGAGTKVLSPTGVETYE